MTDLVEILSRIPRGSTFIHGSITITSCTPSLAIWGLCKGYVWMTTRNYLDSKGTTKTLKKILDGKPGIEYTHKAPNGNTIKAVKHPDGLILRAKGFKSDGSSEEFDVRLPFNGWEQTEDNDKFDSAPTVSNLDELWKGVPDVNAMDLEPLPIPEPIPKPIQTVTKPIKKTLFDYF